MRKGKTMIRETEPNGFITEPITDAELAPNAIDELDAIDDTALDAPTELARWTGLSLADARLLVAWLASALAKAHAPILCLYGHSAPAWATCFAELLQTRPCLLPATLPDVPEPANAVVYYSYVPDSPPDAIWSRIALQAELKLVLIASVYPLETPLPFGSTLPIHLPTQPNFILPIPNAESLRNAIRAIAEYPYGDGELPDSDLPNSAWVGWCFSRAGAFGTTPFEFVDAYRERLTREFEGACAREPILRKIRESAMKGDYAFTPHNLAAEVARFHNATPRRVLEVALQYAGAFAMHGYRVNYDGVMVRISRKPELVLSEREQQEERLFELVRAGLQGDPDRLQTAQTIWRAARRHDFPALALMGQRSIDAGAANYARFISRASEEGLLALLQRLTELGSSPVAEPAGERDAPALVEV